MLPFFAVAISKVGAKVYVGLFSLFFHSPASSDLQLLLRFITICSTPCSCPRHTSFAGRCVDDFMPVGYCKGEPEAC